MIKVILLFFLPLVSKASVLNQGEGYFYSQLSYSTSSSLWLRGDEKADYNGTALLGNGTVATRRYYQAGINGYYGIGHDLQIGAGLKYGIVHLSKAPILGAAKDDTRSQISEMSFEIVYELLSRDNWDLDLAFRYLHPGKQGRKKPEFLSFNDFTQYLELELKHSLYKAGWNLYSLLKYKHSTTSIGNNHLIAEAKGYYEFNDRWSGGAGLDWLTTFGGFDVADQDFNAFFQRNGFLPVWNKDESWVGLSLLGAYQLNQDWKLDGYIHRKLLGENTDISTTIGLGIGRGF